MFDVPHYMHTLIAKLAAHFGSRLTYVGLQGSYLRGEATAASDIDPMVVIEDLMPADLDAYRGIIAQLPRPELSCGFLCSKDDLACWNPLEIGHLLHTTQDWHGQLTQLVPAYTREDVRNFVRLSVGNMLHELCHRYVHGTPEENAAALPLTLKGVFFILQNALWLEQGVFAATKTELLPLLIPADREILQLSMTLPREKDYDFPAAFHQSLAWCRQLLQRMA